ncbi:MAG: peptidoglycan-associated lipoprotein Pal [Thiomargarita sp.]|nr:peptidoglycan-associated lipoprotein Pal [Thiomargarita sp.]
MKIRNCILITLVGTVIVSCANQTTSNPENIAVRTPPPIFSAPDDTSGNITTKSSSIDIRTLDQRIIYFDYNMSEIKSDSYTLLQEHAAYLQENSDVIIRLEGHADERGSREYNLALGEQRAEATKYTLMTLGVQEHQLNTLSYGEEQAIAFGHHEDAWWQNRRVELVYP